MIRRLLFSAVLAALVSGAIEADACTGITLRSADGAHVVARTIEWRGSDLASGYVIVPRGHSLYLFSHSESSDAAITADYVPTFGVGHEYKARYGFVGLTVERQEFATEGLNEKGLSAGLFYFPGYGQYQEASGCGDRPAVNDLQLVTYILANCASVADVVDILDRIAVVAIDPRADTAHWRFADTTGRQIVLEFIDGKAVIYENELGVLTNSPDFGWHIRNLNTYVNLLPGNVPPRDFGNIRLSAFGGGAAMLGLPGDMTPPSRFIRAAFFQTSAPVLETAGETVLQAFHILNNFDIPTGAQFGPDEKIVDIPSATQWTTATDITGKRLYYRTMYDSSIRCFDLSAIDFGKVRFVYKPLDKDRKEKITFIKP